MARKEQECKFCKKLFVTKSHSPVLCCSGRCAQYLRGGGPPQTVTCEQCKSQIVRQHAKVKVKNFCNRSCRSRYTMLNASMSHRTKMRSHASLRFASDKEFGFKKGHTGFLSPDHYNRLSVLLSGARNYAWRGGITPENKHIRNSLEYKNWRTSVFKRDDYQCQMPGCLGKTNKINANHILKFSDYPDRRLEISNGITLCVDCHRHIHFKEVIYKKLFTSLVESYV